MDCLSINQKTIGWLNSARGISNGKIEKLLNYFEGNTTYLWDNFECEKKNLQLKEEIIIELSRTKDSFEENMLKKLNEHNAFAVTIFDETYPLLLKEIVLPPYILYCRGSIKNIDNLSIAVVGSRKATSYGKWATEKFTRELSEIGVNIVSGLAAGIDSVAHKTALKCGAKTIGVIGCGIDVVYPKINEQLYNEIAEKDGAVITEYFFGMQPMPNNFHDRNRIISGLSHGVLVIEAQERSGTLITAGHAADQGREIFAVPGNIDSIYSKGTNALIRDGAKITSSLDDIIEEIPLLKEKSAKKNSIDLTCLSSDEMKVIKSILSGNKTVYEIAGETGLETPLLLSILTFLEMKGKITKISGNKFSLNQ
ncbi:DNA-processing protein DprA [Sedimentibacter saalensis]|uniref:DNA processing protein n=1 Tax=Sedimentibacter saalensis TaxID=130788 RepID=A0A562JGN1_9FIRM|nr:DNA-processing protein DprA [Sedimentibacter saalensis]TWH82319.1 DNA processing protein [Sedimentibacter saalensis]